jgi:hypothetical protein
MWDELYICANKKTLGKNASFWDDFKLGEGKLILKNTSDKEID